MELTLSTRIQPSYHEIVFWSNQIREHVFIVNSYLNDQTAFHVKEEAKRLYAGWSDLLCEYPSKDVQFSCWLLLKTYEFLELVKNKIRHEPAIYIGISGEDFHALIDHMIVEQTYFVRLASGKVTVQEELIFWAQENAEHTALLSKSLPCGELKDTMLGVSDLLFKIKIVGSQNPAVFADELNLLHYSDNAALNVHKYVHSGELKLDDRILEHELREAKIGEQRVAFLLKGLSTPASPCKE